MIRILATALLALSLTASGAFATSIDDLLETDGLWYKKFTDVPFTGVVDEGLKRGAIKNGKREGPWVKYYENGRIWYKGAYKKGKQEGPWLGYHNNGQLWSEGAYKNGKFEGPWIAYYDDGQLWSKGTYKNGKFEGPWFWYQDHGQLPNKGEYKNGKFKGRWVVSREDGSKAEVSSGIDRNGKKVSD